MASISDKTDHALGELDKTGVALIDVKTGLSNTIVEIKSDTISIKAYVATFQSNLLKVKDDLVKVENRIEIVDQKFVKEVDKVKGDIKLVYKKVDSHETHISKLEENFQGLKTEVGVQIAAASSSLRKNRTMNIITDN